MNGYEYSNPVNHISLQFNKANNNFVEIGDHKIRRCHAMNLYTTLADKPQSMFMFERQFFCLFVHLIILWLLVVYILGIENYFENIYIIYKIAIKYLLYPTDWEQGTQSK